MRDSLHLLGLILLFSGIISISSFAKELNLEYLWDFSDKNFDCLYVHESSIEENTLNSHGEELKQEHSSATVSKTTQIC